MTPHIHIWLPYAQNATGYWQKRDCPGDGVYFKGTAEQCECGAMQFVPDDSRLCTVGCTL